MEKVSERMNVLTEGNGKNFVHCILNAVTKGYSDDTIIDDVLELVQSKEVSRGVLDSTPEALRSYASNFQRSLDNIAKEIEDIEFPEEQRIRRKDRNQESLKIDTEAPEDEDEIEEVDEDNEDEKVEIEDDDKDEEDQEDEKDVKVEEDWDKYEHNEKENKISGSLKIAFNQDMSIYKQGSKMNLSKSTLGYIQKNIFDYLHKEYPRVKSKLSTKIFKSNLIFDNLKKGEAQIKYEIKNAY